MTSQKHQTTSPSTDRKQVSPALYKIQNDQFEKKRTEAQRYMFELQQVASYHSKSSLPKTTQVEDHEGTDKDIQERMNAYLKNEGQESGNRKHLGMMLALARLYHAPLGQVLKQSRDTKTQTDNIMKMMKELDGRMFRLIQLAKEHAHPVEKFDPSQTSNTIIVKDGRIREPTEEEMEEGVMSSARGLLRKVQQVEVDEAKQKARKAKETASKLQSQISAIRKYHSESKVMSQTISCLNHFTTRFGGSILKVDLILPENGIILSISSTGSLEFWEHPNLPIESSHDAAFNISKKQTRKAKEKTAAERHSEALQPRLVELQDIDLRKIGFITCAINLKNVVEIVDISPKNNDDEATEIQASTSTLQDESKQAPIRPEKLARYRGLYLLGTEKGYAQLLEIFCDATSGTTSFKTSIRVSSAYKISHSPILFSAYLSQDDFVYIFGTDHLGTNHVTVFRIFSPPTDPFSPIPEFPSAILSWSARPMSSFGLSQLGRFPLIDFFDVLNVFEQKERKQADKKNNASTPVDFHPHEVDKDRDSFTITCVKADEVSESIQVSVTFSSFPEMAVLFRINYSPLDSVDNGAGEKVPDRQSKNRKFETYVVFKVISQDFTELLGESSSPTAAREKYTASFLPFKILDFKRHVNFQTHRAETVVTCSDSSIRIISTYVATMGVEQHRYQQPNMTAYNLFDSVCYNESAQLLVTFDQDGRFSVIESSTLKPIGQIRLLLGFQTDAKPTEYQPNDVYRPIPQALWEFIPVTTRISVLSKMHHLVVVSRGADWSLIHIEQTRTRLEEKNNERLGFGRQTLKLDGQYLGAG